jgi:hypothetical protein
MSSISEAAPSLPAATVREDAHTVLAELPGQEASVTIHIPQYRSGPIPWWLWWNVLSLDAPAVAGAWSILLLRSRGLTVRYAEVFALVLAVWVIYTTDRLLDGLASCASSILQARHFLAAKYRIVFASLALLSGAALLWISMEHLEARTMRAGLILGAIVIFYLASIHGRRSHVSKLLPKEIAVGLIFAAGTSVPLWSRSEGLTIFTGCVWLLLAFLCSLNCLSIECWERPRSGGEWRQRPSPWIAWADSHLNSVALGLTIVAVVAYWLSGPSYSSRLPLPAIALAAFLTMILNSHRRNLSPEVLRVLADAALLVPALLALGLLY